MKPTIYIAGPMRDLPNNNREAFNAAAKRLSENGWQPVNPVDIERCLPCVGDDGKVDFGARERLTGVLRHIIDTCDAMYLLDGWTRSVGAMGDLTAFLDSCQEQAEEGVLVDVANAVFLESDGVPSVLPRAEDCVAGGGQ